MPPIPPATNTDADALSNYHHSGFDVGVPYPLSDAAIAHWDSTTTTMVLAGVFFGISAALLVVALPLVLCNYCRARRLSTREGRLEI
ncbi:hypothetical protein F5B21DRAFT_488015 [Xylaria acuta]|nr:hypothetical protein F5B21DRAFT_488015 [Xylaria acuta]